MTKQMKYESNLSKENAMALFVKYDKKRNSEIRNHLVENYLYLAKILSQKYRYKNGDNEDIFQVACIGLMYAVDRFDPDRGYTFETFATPTILGEIKRHYRDKETLIRIPRKIQELNQQVNQAQVLLEQKNMRSPTISEISNYLDVSEESIIAAMESNHANYPMSLNDELDTSNDDKLSLMDLLGTTDHDLENVENIDLIKRISETFTPVERIVIEQRFLRRKTQKEVALFLKRSQMTVSRLENTIKLKIKAGF